MKLIYCILLACCFLAGCTAELNQESVKTYSNHSLNQFIKNRFTIDDPLNDLVQSGLDTVARARQRDFYDYYAMSKPMPDGTYVYFAAFNGVKTLERPRNDLALFCKLKGGTLKNSAPFSKDILSSYEVNPTEAYLASVRELSQVRMTAGNFSRPLSDGEINAISMNEAIRTENANRFSDIAYAKKDYFSAVNEGSFGIFNCFVSNKRILWQVSIIPIAYQRSDKEHFLSDALYIGIKGKE